MCFNLFQLIIFGSGCGYTRRSYLLLINGFYDILHSTAPLRLFPLTSDPKLKKTEQSAVQRQTVVVPLVAPPARAFVDLTQIVETISNITKDDNMSEKSQTNLVDKNTSIGCSVPSNNDSSSSGGNAAEEDVKQQVCNYKGV